MEDVKHDTEVTKTAMWNEYVQKMHDDDLIRVTREAALEEGEEIGEARGDELRLIRQVQRKLVKGKAPEQIADELEEEAEKIEFILDAVTAAGEGADATAVYAKMRELLPS